MLYFSRFSAFDPYLAFGVDGRKVGLSSSMEYGRMQDESAFDEVLLLPEVESEAAKRFKLPKGKKPDETQIVRHLAKVYGVNEFRVSHRFPAGLAFALSEAGLKITPDENGGLFPERVQKTAEEVEALRKGNDASAAGFRIVAKTLAESKVKRGKLIHQGRVLTSERLRELISQAALEKDAIAQHTIAAGGDQACECHNAGSGPIRPNELIVVDIFPRRTEDGYWGDMTRTFLKGKASDAQKKLVRTVKKAHGMGIDMIKPGVSGGKVQQAIEQFFAKEGYETIKNSTEPEGFFHGLGHGIGLEVHEAPFMRLGAKWRFKKGMVVTVEPGLYYRGIGGVRIEDTIHVTPGGNELISKAPYKWEIP
ncbi:peptidase M24 [Haloferula helveola]|uniref:Peptidase M24 n=2 Tax=Haloferula helveola TaxID=490095 RepID=A0ABM7RCF6_9BACT|nr:peptidase M24 [Haloferula helveola]